MLLISLTIKVAEILGEAWKPYCFRHPFLGSQGNAGLRMQGPMYIHLSYKYVIVIPQYTSSYNILVINQVQDEAKNMGDN